MDSIVFIKFKLGLLNSRCVKCKKSIDDAIDDNDFDKIQENLESLAICNKLYDEEIKKLINSKTN